MGAYPAPYIHMEVSEASLRIDSRLKPCNESTSRLPKHHVESEPRPHNKSRSRLSTFSNFAST